MFTLNPPTTTRLAPGLLADDKTTQFTTRLVDGEVLTEEVIRLANDYPTTVREKAIHDKELLVGDSLPLPSSMPTINLMLRP
jgi:hypothetical protein